MSVSSTYPSILKYDVLPMAIDKEGKAEVDITAST